MKPIFTIMIFFITILSAYAQKEDYNWVFGDNCGLNFNTSGNVPISYSVNNCDYSERSSVISDSAGNLKLFVQGYTLCNRDFNVIGKIGSGYLDYDLPSPDRVIVKDPNEKNIYYVFYVDNDNPWDSFVGGLFYSKVDISLKNGFGDILEYNHRVDTISKNGVIALSNFDHTSYWMISFNYDKNTYFVYFFKDGLVQLKHQTKSVNDVPIFGSFDLKFNKFGNLISSCIGNIISVYEFDIKTGTMTLSKSIKSNDSNTYFISAEFSPNNKYLYAIKIIRRDSSILQNIELIQFDLTSNSEQEMIDNQFIIYKKSDVSHDTREEIGSILSAPDDKIYIARYGVNYLSSIDYPNEKGFACGFNPVALKLTSQCYRGLPNIYYNPLCTPYEIPLPDTIHTCGGQPAAIGAVGDTSFVYRWEPAYGLVDSATSMTEVRADTNIIYTLYATNKVSGCLYSAIVHVVPEKYVLTIPDTVQYHCDGSAVTIGAPNDTNFTYRWEPTYGLADAASSMTEVKTDSNITYTLFATNKLYGCMYSAHVFIKVDQTDFAGIIEAKPDVGDICLNTLNNFDFTLTNKASYPITIDGISSNNDGEVQIINNFSGNLLSGESKNISFEFNAKNVGKIIDTIYLNISSPCKFTYPIPISGNIIPGKLNIWTSDTLAAPGGIYCLPVFAAYKCSDNKSLTISYQMKVRISKQLFKPTSVSSGKLHDISEDNGDYVVGFSDSGVQLSGDSTMINTICGIVNIGDIEKTPITVDSVQTSAGYDLETHSGTLSTNICRNDLRQIHIISPTILSVLPNPATDNINVSVTTQDNGVFHLELISTIGDLVWSNEFTNTNDNVYENNFSIPANQIGSGIYFVRLRSPWETMTEKVIVDK